MSLLDEFQSGATLYLPGASGEIVALADALAADPGRMAGVQIISCLLPGINAFDYAGLDPEGRLTLFLLPPAARASFVAGRVRLLPLTYSGIANYIGRQARIDTAFAHVSPPDRDGRCSFGVAADFSPIAWEVARRRIAVINTHMPRTPGPSILISDADLVVELQSPIIEAQSPSLSSETEAIVGRAAGLVPDGAAIQIGIGGAPAALWGALGGHRALRIRSGLVSGDVIGLANAGALDPAAIQRAGMACGDTTFYKELEQSGLIQFADTRTTHGAAWLAEEEKFVAANSALEIDLLGQVNLEWQGGRVSSGVGGAPDFARAAMASPGGRSMILMPSTARRKTISRIVPQLAGPAVSLARDQVDTVVTEHGVAELRGLSIDERAVALIAIAAPPWQEELSRRWHALRATF